MIRGIKNRIRKYHEGIILWAAHDVRKVVIGDLMARIGLEQLEKIVERGKLNRKEKGHTDYTNLGELYFYEAFTGTPHRIEELENQLKEIKQNER